MTEANAPQYIIGLLCAAIVALFGVIVYQMKRADAKHDAEIARIQADAVRLEQSAEKTRAVNAEQSRVIAQLAEAVREMARSQDRHTEAMGRYATEAAATREFIRSLRSGAHRAVRPESDR